MLLFLLNYGFLKGSMSFLICLSNSSAQSTGHGNRHVINVVSRNEMLFTKGQNKIKMCSFFYNKRNKFVFSLSISVSASISLSLSLSLCIWFHVYGIFFYTRIIHVYAEVQKEMLVICPHHFVFLPQMGFLVELNSVYYR